MVYAVLGLYNLACVGADVLEIGTSSVDWAHLSRFHLKTEFSLQNLCLKQKQDDG
jgi:hypothetical protein